MFISFVCKLNKRFPHTHKKTKQQKHEKEENINNQEPLLYDVDSEYGETFFTSRLSDSCQDWRSK
jgi:hypothetical protein